MWSLSLKKILLYFLVPPKVTVDKEQVFVRPGGGATVLCLAVGIPPPVVNWYKNENALGLEGRVYANDAGELVIGKALASDAGNYTCTARSAWGSTSVIIEVIVGGITIKYTLICILQTYKFSIYKLCVFVCLYISDRGCFRMPSVWKVYFLKLDTKYFQIFTI